MGSRLKGKIRFQVSGFRCHKKRGKRIMKLEVGMLKSEIVRTEGR